MKRAISAVAAIGGFGVGVAVLSVVTTASIILIVPEPPALRMTVRDAAAAIRSNAKGFERRYGVPPEGRRAPLIEQVLATELARPPDAVRAVWLGSAPPTGIVISSRIPLDRSPDSPVVLMKRKGTLEMIRPGAVAGLLHTILLAQPQPPFIASVRNADGQWLSVQPRQPLLSGWRVKVLAALAVSLLLLAPLAWIFARRLTRPFRVLARAIDDIGVPITQEGPRELREAAAAITGMRVRLADEAAERARMLTAIAHDLRTPLTSLRLRIEAAPEPQRGRMVADVERMQGMIDEVLSFARDAAAPSQRVGVRAVLAEVIADMDPGNERVRLAPGSEAWVDVPVPAFRRMIENLIGNAIDYADGCTIEVLHSNGQVTVSVIDNGPGIAPADRERLLRPFERGDASRNRATGGAGLGLSIVRDFAARHRGHFALRGNAEGGTTAALRLPAYCIDAEAVLDGGSEPCPVARSRRLPD